MPFLGSVRSSYGIQGRFNKLPLAAANGLTAATAGSSAYQIKQDTGTTTDGLYWIKNANINSNTPFQVYCDMNTDGGGWTLLLTSTNSDDWNSSNWSLRNQGSPSFSSTYSIIAYGDYIKRSSSGYQYMLGANTSASSRSDWVYGGGIFTSNQNYSFTSTSNGNTDITVNQWFTGSGSSFSNDGIEQRQPWYSGIFGSGAYTTSAIADGSWWGTLITNGWASAAPWVSGYMSDPTHVWLWVR